MGNKKYVDGQLQEEETAQPPVVDHDAFMSKYGGEQVVSPTPTPPPPVVNDKEFEKKYGTATQEDDKPGVMEAAMSGFSRGATLGLNPKVVAFLRSIKDPNIDPNSELKSIRQREKLAESEHYLPYHISEIAGSALPYGIATAFGGPPGLASVALVDAANRQDAPTKQELKTMTPYEYATKKTIEAGDDAVVTTILDKGFRKAGSMNPMPNAEDMALRGAGATMSTRSQLRKSLPIDGESEADAVAHYLMSEKGIGLTPQSVLSHVKSKSEKIGHEIGSYVEKSDHMFRMLPKDSKFHFETDGKKLADEIRQSVVIPSEKLMNPERAAAGEKYARLAEELGTISPKRLFDIRRDLDKTLRQMNAFNQQMPGAKEGMLEVRNVIDSHVVDNVTRSEIFENLADPRAVEMALNGQISDKQFLYALNGAIEKYNKIKSGQITGEAADNLIAKIERPEELRQNFRLLKSVEKVAQYGTDRAQGNNLFGLGTLVLGGGATGGAISGGSLNKALAAMGITAGTWAGKKYGPLSYARAAGALRQLPNPLDTADSPSGYILKKGAQTYPAQQVSQKLLDYLYNRQNNQGEDE